MKSKRNHFKTREFQCESKVLWFSHSVDFSAAFQYIFETYPIVTVSKIVGTNSKTDPFSSQPPFHDIDDIIHMLKASSSST